MFLVEKPNILDQEKVPLNAWGWALVFAWLLPAVLQAQLDTLHFLPPLHSRNTGHIEDHYLYLSTPEIIDVTVEVNVGGGTPFPGSPFTISNGSPLILEIGNGQLNGSPLMVAQYELNEVLTERGLVVHASAPVYANARYRSYVQAEALTAKGTKALGTEFRFVGMPNGSEQDIRSFVIGVMAADDGTSVEITEFDPNIEFAGAPNVTVDSWAFELDAGESFVLSGYANSTANLAGFVGALIESTGPIAVSTGNWCGALQIPQDQDIAIDQIVPFDYLGLDHVFVEGNGLPEQERGLVVAVADGTEVWLNDDASPAITLQAGEWFLIPNSALTGTLHRNIYVHTSEPAYVCQFLAGSPQLATPGMNFIPSLSCGMPHEVNEIPSIELIGNQTYDGCLFIITEAGAELLINGVLQSGSEPVIGQEIWETYKIEGLTGNVSVASSGPVAVGMFGQSGSAGWAGYYSGFSLDISAEFDLTESICPGDSGWVAFTGNALGGATLNWDFDGLAVEGTGDEIVILPSEPGTYSISLVVQGDGCSDFEAHDVTFQPTIVSSSEAIACDEWLWEGQTLTSSGIYSEIYSSAITGCDSLVELALTVIPSPNPLLTSGGLDSTIYCATSSSVVLGLATTDDYEYEWSFLAPGSLEWLGLLDSIGMASYIGPGLYEVYAHSGAPCFHEAVMSITVEEGACNLIIPNVFSPNQDGRNDRFYVAGLEPFEGARIEIFNRWGELMFSHSDFGKSAGWDPGNSASEGVYYFTLTVPMLESGALVEDIQGIETHQPPADLVRHGAFQLVR